MLLWFVIIVDNFIYLFIVWVVVFVVVLFW